LISFAEEGLLKNTPQIGFTMKRFEPKIVATALLP